MFSPTLLWVDVAISSADGTWLFHGGTHGKTAPPIYHCFACRSLHNQPTVCNNRKKLKAIAVKARGLLLCISDFPQQLTIEKLG
jgi:hypothetical protein